MSQILPVEIIGTGFHVPEKIVTNEDYEKQYGISAEWIKQVCGIESRHICAPNEACSHMAIPAAKKAIESAKINPEEIDLIILSTINSDYAAPPGSCLIQLGVGAKNAACFDVDCACLGYVWALHIGAQFIALGQYRNVLVVASEVCSRAANYNDPKTFILLGDGAGAAILRKSEDGSGILSSYFRADGTRWEAATIKACGTMYPDTKKLPEGITMDDILFSMNGPKVYKFAIKAMTDAVESVIEKAGLEKRDIKLVIPHQANYRILKSAVKKMGLGDSQHFVNVQKYGNTGAATVAIALADAVEKGKICKGDNIVLTGFGSGLSWGAIVLRW
jgi:3-oxoacyl-[acyl-carrier-protein] synthase-3